MSTASEVENVTSEAAIEITATVTTGQDEISAQEPPKYLRPNFERMPAELKSRRTWVVWKYLPPQSNGGKWRKVPFHPNGTPAKTTDAGTWSTFDECCQAYATGFFSGIGFVFDGVPDENGLVLAGVDFDHVIANNDIHSLAAERIKSIGSYFERSISGDGLHVVLKARPLERGISYAGTEMYTQGRFFVMTGRAYGNGQIAAAPEAFAALAAQLRSQGNAPGGSQPQPQNEVANTDQPDTWFDNLPAGLQSEAVRYAAQQVSTHSTLFELTKNGGNYQDYLRLTLAIVRSKVSDAEQIFVDAASSAKDADPVDELRKWFQNCEQAKVPSDGVSVGTLFHIATQHGADFSHWRRLGTGNPQAEAVLYVPGNEDVCRRRLDEVVSQDPRTFTLGDRGGPLVILRVPNTEVLPDGAKWESDLPGTTLATPADVMLPAERLEWKRRSGGMGANRLVRTHPPRSFVADYLTQMRGQYRAPPLRGIVRVPRIDDDGRINFISGYDPLTGLFHDSVVRFDVPANPTDEEIRKATEGLLLPFSKYQFDDPVAGNALLLAGTFTALERPFLAVAPMFAVRSSMPATGKGLIVRCWVRLAYATVPIVITWGGSGEEFEKRLGALLLHAPAALSIDNANGMQLQGDLLETILTEGGANIRPLGVSETVTVRARAFMTLTGNNPIITGDMARRTLSLDIQPRSPDPERDRYGFNPAQVVERHRTGFLRAAFAIMRAYRLAGMPSGGLPAVGSYDDWTRKVRDLVFWLTGYDVSDGFRRNKAEDPRRQADMALLAALYQNFGTAPFKSADAVTVHKKVADQKRNKIPAALTEQALHDAMEDVLGGRKVEAKLFGYWARRVQKAPLGGYKLEIHHHSSTNTNSMTVRCV